MINDPILYFPFDEASGDALDASGDGHDGVLTGGSRVTGHVGSAVHLGSGEHIDFTTLNFGVPGAFFLGSTYTVALWLKGHLDGVVAGEAPGNYAFYYDSTTLYSSAGAGNFVATDHGGIYDVWTHVAIVRSGATGQFYKNGVPLGAPQTFGTPANGMYLSRINGYTSSAFQADMDVDEFRVYNRALSDADVAELYAFDADTPPPAAVAEMWGVAA